MNHFRLIGHAALSFTTAVFFANGGIGLLFGSIFLLFQISLLLHKIEQLENKIFQLECQTVTKNALSRQSFQAPNLQIIPPENLTTEKYIQN